LSAAINSLFPDTCALEEGERGQFELFQSGKSFMSAGHGKFFDLEDVKKKLTESGQDLFTNRKKEEIMNFWVEYWNDINKKNNGSHAQMKEQIHWVEPDPNIISRRYFSTMVAATEFAKKIEKDGQMIRIKQDGKGY